MSTELMQLNSEKANKIIRATDKAVEYTNNNPEEALRITAEYLGYNKDLMKGMTLPLYKKSTEMNEVEVQELADLLFEYENLDSEIDTSVLFI